MIISHFPPSLSFNFLSLSFFITAMSGIVISEKTCPAREGPIPFTTWRKAKQKRAGKGFAFPALTDSFKTKLHLAQSAFNCLADGLHSCCLVFTITIRVILGAGLNACCHNVQNTLGNDSLLAALNQHVAFELHSGLRKHSCGSYCLDHSIHLSAKNAGNYINRALARFHQNNLRGAMSDYDLALDIDPNNFLGHYNRGLLRAQVGDDNRAIEDFDFVLQIEPDNMMATFNRGLLRAQTGNYRGAISDYSKVIDEYPNFMAGYYHRAEARKKIGDRKGAEQDEFKLMKMQIDKRNGVTADNKDVADNNAQDGEDKSKTRKKSDKNMDNYRKIVIADDSEQDEKYKSDYRGRVQDRNVSIKMEPMYALTYYEKLSEVKRIVHFHSYWVDFVCTRPR